jgi:hypothetical protein
VFGIFLWGSGAQRKVINALHSLGLSISHESTRALVGSLSTHGLARARIAARLPHMLSYDNINMSTSNFVEQRGYSTPDKVQSGTYGFIYIPLIRTDIDANAIFSMETLLKHCPSVPSLSFAIDISASFSQLSDIRSEFVSVVCSILVRHTNGFEEQSSHHLLRSTPRRPLPEGYVTEYFPTRITTIEEATREGNLDYHDDVYFKQLAPDDESAEETSARLSRTAIICANDGLTNQRNRGGQLLRIGDVDNYERRKVFQVSIGLFHMLLNLIWALLLKHRGSVHEHGSLANFFVLLDKKRLGSQHPDFHTLLATLMQILDGLILEAWRQKTASSSLSEYSRQKPTPAAIQTTAQEIVDDYASPFWSESEDPNDDKVHCNMRLLIRDLMLVAALTSAFSDGDFGRVEILLTRLAAVFRAAGSNNYCFEILHLILNLKYVWTPEFALVIIYITYFTMT